MQKDECYADIYKEYTDLFQKKESHLMKICGWSSASDANWVEDMQTLSLRSEGLYLLLLFIFIIVYCILYCCHILLDVLYYGPV